MLNGQGLSDALQERAPVQCRKHLLGEEEKWREDAGLPDVQQPKGSAVFPATPKKEEGQTRAPAVFRFMGPDL